MKINGVELEFELFDADNEELKNRYFQELEKMKTIKADMPEGTEHEKSVYLCEKVKRLFDHVFSEGIGEKVCMRAYRELVYEQLRQQNAYEEILSSLR